MTPLPVPALIIPSFVSYNFTNVHPVATQANSSNVFCVCASLAEVQGNGPIVVEIRHNTHQLSFTSFIFIGLPTILTTGTTGPVLRHRSVLPGTQTHF